MDAFRRLSQLSRTVKERASSIWKSASAHLWHVWLWLTVPRDPVDWKGALAKASTWLQLRTISRVIAGFVFVALLVFIVPRVWEAYSTHLPAIIPLGAGIGGAIVAWAALTQAATARRRHEEQTGADRQRRLTESYSTAVTQLASDKLEERLGGIYTLESISKESPDDYWTVMETLTAFVRERSRRNEAERTSQDFDQRVSRYAYLLWQKEGQPSGQDKTFWTIAVEQEKYGEPPATDISPVLTVIKRRSELNRKRERIEGWRFDFSGAVLRHADLSGAHLERAYFSRTSWARIWKGPTLSMPISNGLISLYMTHLDGAHFSGAHLEGTNFSSAHLNGVDLSVTTHGDAWTRLPPGMARPRHWPPPK
jgi:Pentapeptide repeats (8 copies)/Protein of unknown function (DUF2934)